MSLSWPATAVLSPYVGDGSTGGDMGVEYNGADVEEASLLGTLK
ncbi:MAG: hypothetical protein VX963_03600 [Actinomycetota bacterium]|jgi:hypothetical protein|nr:hypothetical protein [Actinomycetota bacterium]MEC9058757.1 hypothetical protein [Actinomycetota bacterium]